MARWFGVVGYAISRESIPGVFVQDIVEREYAGDTIKQSTNWQNSSNAIDNMSVSTRISIIADPFAYENFAHIRYVELMSYKWKVTSAEPQYPRIILTIGGVYNEKSSSTT